MDMHDLTRQLKTENKSKIVMLVADGLGGLPLTPACPTELEAAATPHLDGLARRGVLGTSIPVAPGITPGSGPGHLALFGYDPIKYQIGRGALEATGIGFELGDEDVAARCNFCTLADGKITDRRAGRIESEKSRPLVMRLRDIRIPGIEVIVKPVREHRFVVVFRGAGLGEHVHDTDPGSEGKPPDDPTPGDAESERTASAARQFIKTAGQMLADQEKANFVTMRGFAHRPVLPSYQDVYGLRAAAIAVYPMYKGLAKLVGMDVAGHANNLDEQIGVLKANWDAYDFFFLHFKYTDSTGEDGDFAAKVQRIEELDAALPRIMALQPTVITVTGDHSTPARWKSHSWHGVPTLLFSDVCRTDACEKFGETECLRGGLGQFRARYLMPLLLANAGRLSKFGA